MRFVLALLIILTVVSQAVKAENYPIYYDSSCGEMERAIWDIRFITNIKRVISTYRKSPKIAMSQAVDHDEPSEFDSEIDVNMCYNNTQ